MHTIETAQHAGRTVNVYIDDDPQNPRTEYDCASLIVHWHRRYDFGRRVSSETTEETIREWAADRADVILAILPLFLYDHGGLVLRCGAFGDPFDSGQVGFVYIDKKTSDTMGYEDLSTAEYEAILRQEIQTYNHYLSGEVYGYEVVGAAGDVLESCGGFVGDAKFCMSEGKEAAESSSDPAVDVAADELSNRPTFAAGTC